jgi:hypothetical protein
MEYRDFMMDATRIFNERNPKYGDMRVGMGRVAQIASILTNMELTPHDIALVLHAVKLSRIGNDRQNPDHYVDGINYLAFAGELLNDRVGNQEVEIESHMARLEREISEAATRNVEENQEQP